MSLMVFPTEVLVIISSLITRTRTLCRLMLCNRRLSSIVWSIRRQEGFYISGKQPFAQKAVNIKDLECEIWKKKKR